MSKSILVIDTPENCEDCNFFYQYNKDNIDSAYCRVVGEEKKTSIMLKPDWCPLRDFPEKSNHPDYCDNGRYDKGWNDCIDEILKGANENDERTV